MSPKFKKSKGAEDPEVVPTEECYAKTNPDGSPGCTVLEHCCTVGEVSRALLGFLHPAVVRELGSNPAFVAAVHDIGKVSPGFLKKYFNDSLLPRHHALAARSLDGFETNHALISEAALNEYYGGLDTTAIAWIAGIHHGKRKKAAPPSDKVGNLGGAAWSAQRRALLLRLAEEFGDPPEPELNHVQRAILAGLVCTSDWIGSDEALFANDATENDSLEQRAGEAVRTCGWRRHRFQANLSFSDIFGFEPYPAQEAFVNAVNGPGLYVLEAPMGMGKTEAALYAAYRLWERGDASGLYFGLPTRLTSDRIHERVSTFLDRICVDAAAARLAHGHAWLNRALDRGRVNENEENGSAWFSPRKRALLWPFTVGTIDQALMGILRVKHYFMRLFGLAGKVVILDEVHSYDMYTGTLLDLLVEQLLVAKCTVIVLSATLTGKRRNLLCGLSGDESASQAYPLITVRAESEVRAVPCADVASRDVYVRMMNWGARDVAENAVAHAMRGECVLCIANTVARAQEWYNCIRGEMGEGAFDVGLLHSKFLPWRRSELEAEWMSKLGKGKGENRPQGCILVATQVVEQSVDLDADFMITELAPTDMLLQRLGRLWRHERAQRPVAAAEMVVVTKDLEGVESIEEFLDAVGKPNAHVYAPYVLWRSWLVWHGQSSIRIPEGVRGLLEDTYSEPPGKEPAFAAELKERMDSRRKKLRRLAYSAKADVDTLPTTNDDDRAGTRYSDLPMVDALLVQNIDVVGMNATIELLDGSPALSVCAFLRDLEVSARLHSNLVSIPGYRLEGVETPVWLRKHFFGPTEVLALSETNALLRDGQPTGLRYDQERGLHLDLAGTPRESSTRRGGWDDPDVGGYSDFDDVEEYENECFN